MNKHLEDNQTQFAAQEPIRENLATYAEPTQVVENDKTPPAKNKKILLFGVIGFVLVIVFFLLLVLIMALSPKKTAVVDKNGNLIEQPSGEANPLLEEVLLLNQELDTADPTIDTIPFPPVEMDLRLDPPQRN